MTITMDMRTRVGLAAQIAATLRQRILAGELAPGAQLRQDRVAAEFGSSHIPVREAFRNLEQEGLVEHQPRRGAFVAPLYPAEAEEVTLMRVALEPLAIRLAVPNLTDGDLAAARKFATEAEAEIDIAARRAANWAFHRALYAPCDRRRILTTIETLWLQVDRYFATVWHLDDNAARAPAEHEAILSAAEAGEASRAASLVRGHVEASGRNLMRLLRLQVSGKTALQSRKQAE